MSVPDWYDLWAIEHATAFGFNADQTKTVLAWGPVFVRLFHPAELSDATAHMLASADAPTFAADHRGALIRAVEAVRRRATGRAHPPGQAAGCIECRGSGLVVVPHPGMAEDADPPRWRQVLLMPTADPRGLTRTTAVCCVLCDKGRLTREASERADRPLMTISQYEHQYPNWRAVEAERLKVLTAGRSEPSAEDVARLHKLLDTYRKAAARRAA